MRFWAVTLLIAYGSTTCSGAMDEKNGFSGKLQRGSAAMEGDKPPRSMLPILLELPGNRDEASSPATAVARPPVAETQHTLPALASRHSDNFGDYYDAVRLEEEAEEARALQAWVNAHKRTNVPTTGEVRLRQQAPRSPPPFAAPEDRGNIFYEDITDMRENPGTRQGKEASFTQGAMLAEWQSEPPPPPMVPLHATQKEEKLSPVVVLEKKGEEEGRLHEAINGEKRNYPTSLRKSTQLADMKHKEVKVALVDMVLAFPIQIARRFTGWVH